MSIRPLLLLVLVGCSPTISDVDIDVDTSTEPVDTDVIEEPFVLEDAVRVEEMMDHLERLQAIADARAGSRHAMSLGYEDSVEYVIETVEQAGYTVTLDTFPARRFNQGASSLQVTAPESQDLQASVFAYSGAGAVEANLYAVDVMFPPGAQANTSTSGCDASDFDGFPAGAVALIQRGTCTFQIKMQRAADAGAAAAIVFNEGQDGRRDIVRGNLEDTSLSVIPMMGVSFETGEYLAGLEGARVRLDVQTELFEGDDKNVLITIPGKDRSRTLLVGAHLDSVEVGPGINDNGSGTAFLLEIAQQAAEGGWQPETDVRLAWWAAEEIGLVGSRNYFLDDDNNVDMQNLDTVEGYLNFDMMASSNGARFVYDGDASSTDRDIANPGSVIIEQHFLDWFADRDMVTRPVGIVDRADSYWAVIMGMPWGGLFSGAEERKSDAEAEAFGGQAGRAYDPCYHEACDALDQIDEVLYADLAAAGASIVQLLAESEQALPEGDATATEGSVNGRGLRDLPRPYGCHGELIFDR